MFFQEILRLTQKTKMHFVESTSDKIELPLKSKGGPRRRSSMAGSGLIEALALGFLLTSACTVLPPRAKVSDQLVRNVPFEARPSSDSGQFRPRVLVFQTKADNAKVPEEWVEKAEKEFWRQLERAGVYVLLKPQEIGLDPATLGDRKSWDWTKIQQAAREKSIPLFMEWELAPIKIEQEADPVGIIRQRRREIVVQVKARLMDSRKGTDTTKELGEARQQDKDVLWMARTNVRSTVADYDPLTLEYLLKGAVADLVPKLVAQVHRVSWSGRVAMIKGDRVYLNVGRQSGLQTGDILKVLDVGDEVFDPETGQSIGKVPGRMKGTLEVISYFGQDGSIAVVHSGAGFQENDTVEYY